MVNVPVFGVGLPPDDGPRRISILGATGSIGTSTADLISRAPERYAVEAVTAGRSAEALAAVARRLNARIAVVADPAGLGVLRDALAGSGIAAAAGEAALIEAAARPVDLVVAAIVGAAGLRPTMAAVHAGSTIALANKECLVCAGALFVAATRMAGTAILPVDSEHDAIFQALETRNIDAVERIILTASGGPFRTMPPAEMERVTPAQALRHPNWAMGPKITVDSATMFNKGLEIIEAHHLFGLPATRIEVLVHPQSVVHGLVAYRDGSVLAQLSMPDMRTPIGHCLAWPARNFAPTPRLDLAALGSLTFEAPDPVRFPALRIAREALQAGGWATNILNAANEVGVAAFLEGAIGFGDIARLVEATLAAATAAGLTAEPASVDDALELDAEARHLARQRIGKKPAG